jgi:8-oxo-dGTP pyrophosphatase MutT (NUDIX family)
MGGKGSRSPACATVARVGMSPHVARLREAVGHELIVLPAVSVLPVDPAGRLLLVSAAGHNDGWHILGGAVDPGESPAEAGVRECREETGVEVELTRLLGAFGGREYEVTYPNGDKVAYVTTAYSASIVSGIPVADGEELADVGWFPVASLGAVPLSRFARALLSACGYLEPVA